MSDDIWLDDERDPADHGFAGALWFKTGEGLIAHLGARGALGGIHTLSLDHDLGFGRMTGYDVIVWIEEYVAGGAEPPQHINLHTQNPVGKERMRAARASIYRMARSRL